MKPALSLTAMTPQYHPLAIIPIKAHEPTWADWKVEWGNPQTIGSRLNLLHSIFDVKIHWENKKEIQERLVLLLEVADSFFSCSRIGDADRQRVAAKAFKVVCERMFVDHEVGHDQNYLSSPVFEKLLWFFRKEGDQCNIRPDLRPSAECCGTLLGNDGGKHYLDKARRFTREFCRAAWDYQSYAAKKGLSPANSNIDIPRTHAYLQGHWKLVFDLMQRMDFLEDILDYPCAEERVKEMEEIALATMLPFRTKHKEQHRQIETRKPKDLQDALSAYRRHQPAEVVAILRARLGISR